jgi:hypothetical protein
MDMGQGVRGMDGTDADEDGRMLDTASSCPYLITNVTLDFIDTIIAA